MEVKFIDKCNSTHQLLITSIKNKEFKEPIIIYTTEQNAGIGSRGNSWIGYKGNFFASIAINEFLLPKDLPHVSVSIYFGMLLKEILKNLESKVWLKWPNDLYINNKKVGGLISTKVENLYILSVGINLIKAPENADILDIITSPDELARKISNKFKEKNLPSWHEIFNNFKDEFEMSRKFKSHCATTANEIDLFEAELCTDGSLVIDGIKTYSLR